MDRGATVVELANRTELAVSNFAVGWRVETAFLLHGEHAMILASWIVPSPSSLNTALRDVELSTHPMVDRTPDRSTITKGFEVIAKAEGPPLAERQIPMPTPSVQDEA